MSDVEDRPTVGGGNGSIPSDCGGSGPCRETWLLLAIWTSSSGQIPSSPTGMSPDPRFVVLDGADGAEVTRRFDDHLVARVDEGLGDQVEAPVGSPG